MKIGSVSEIGLSSKLIEEFYADNWPRPIILSETEFYDWQFKSPPLNKGLDTCVVAYDERKGVVAGVMGLNARTFFVRQKELLGAELTTWIVNENYRNSGPGAKILKNIIGKYEILIGMSISKMALPVFMRSGFRYMRQIPRFVKVLNFDAIAEHCSVDEMGVKLVRAWREPNISNYILKECADRDIDRAFSSMKKNLNLFSRSSEDLKWRYTDHPLFSYSLYHVKGSEDSGGVVIVLRLMKTDPGFRIMHVMDIFGDFKSLEAGRSFIEDFAISHQVDVIDFYCTSSRVFGEFLANRWFSIQDDTCFKFPHLFSPIEMRDPPTTSLIYWAKEFLTDFSDLSSMYITKQDADLDRPTLLV